MPKCTVGEKLEHFWSDTVLPSVPGLLRQPLPLTFGAPPSMGHKRRHPTEGRGEGLTEFRRRSQRVLTPLYKLQVKVKQVLTLLANNSPYSRQNHHSPGWAVIIELLNHSWYQLLSQQPARLPSQLHFKTLTLQSVCISSHKQFMCTTLQRSFQLES